MKHAKSTKFGTNVGKWVYINLKRSAIANVNQNLVRGPKTKWPKDKIVKNLLKC